MYLYLSKFDIHRHNDFRNETDLTIEHKYGKKPLRLIFAAAILLRRKLVLLEIYHFSFHRCVQIPILFTPDI